MQVSIYKTDPKTGRRTPTGETAVIDLSKQREKDAFTKSLRRQPGEYD